MSRASKHLAKEKAKTKKAMGDVNVNCPSCGIPIPKDVFLKQDFGTKYRCKVCGKVCFEEWVKGLDFSDVKTPEVPKVEENGENTTI